MTRNLGSRIQIVGLATTLSEVLLELLMCFVVKNTIFKLLTALSEKGCDSDVKTSA
jgi:hypothetical protein